MILKELSNDEFNRFAEKFMLSSMYQTAEYSMVMKNQDYETFLVGLVNDTNDVMAATVILIERLGKFKYAYAPKGYLVDFTNYELLSEFSNEIKKYLKRKNCIAIKICPLIAKTKYTPSTKIKLTNPSYEKLYDNLKKLKYYHLGYNNFFESLKPRFECIVELDKNPVNMFNKLPDDIKMKIRTCDLAGIRIYKGNENNLDFIYEQMREKNDKGKTYVNDMYYNFNNTGKVDVYFAQLDTKAFLINTQKEYQKQIQICNQITSKLFENQGKNNNDVISLKIKEDNKLSQIKNQLVYATNLLRENQNGIVIASIMVIKHRGQVYLTLDGYDKKYEHLCAQDLLIWKLMEKYGSLGYRELNLGGISNPNVYNEKYSPNTEHKLSFNSSSIEYAGDFELIVNMPLYSIYRNSAPLRKVFK